MTGAVRSAGSARPRVTLKLATSLDGRIATSSGESKWITGGAAREQVHRLRAEHHAVLVGSGTVVADDPQLTVRLPGYDGPQPVRVVADGRLRVSPKSKIVQTGWRPGHDCPPEEGPFAVTTIVTRVAADDRRAKRLNEHCVFLEHPDPSDQWLADPLAPESLAMIAYARCLALHTSSLDVSDTKVFLEGGGALAASFLRDDLVDRIEWFRAPIILGAEGKPALADLGVDRLAAAPVFERTAVHQLGPDLWERYVRRDAAV